MIKLRENKCVIWRINKRFDKILQNDETKASLNINKMKKLEKQEQKIMERLKETLNMQQKTVLSFEEMVLASQRAQNKNVLFE